ncbi:telomerase Cajal body protein 1-like isoform X2 [Corticium candelabrum]|nr:telomerase Cajal body protein 1-like isoform X2 [Corticium candelabrum]XP_062522544.1 telomerase Cajal body protein 1-like isoform X2 [Corticium candelabrum]
MKEADTIYDYCWYPAMHSSDPQTCCLVSSAKDQPIHMFDAFSGSLRGSYCSYNHLDEVTSAYSLAFSPDGSQLFSGFNQLLRIFDVTRPGRFAELRSTMTDHGGISGIISCIAFSPTETGVYALGSYNKSIAIYSPDGSVICVLQGQRGGVTHIMFSPDGNRLYTGGRKDAEILCWDVREPGRVLFKVVRDVETNQRIYFDLDRSGRYLVSGHHSGLVTVWDTDEIRQCDDSADNVAQCVKEFSSHKDTVNGVSFHPWLPMLATSCGQRQFLLDSSDDSLADLDVSHREENSVCLWSLS